MVSPIDSVSNAYIGSRFLFEVFVPPVLHCEQSYRDVSKAGVLHSTNSSRRTSHGSDNFLQFHATKQQLRILPTKMINVQILKPVESEQRLNVRTVLGVLAIEHAFHAIAQGPGRVLARSFDLQACQRGEIVGHEIRNSDPFPLKTIMRVLCYEEYADFDFFHKLAASWRDCEVFTGVFSRPEICEKNPFALV